MSTDVTVPPRVWVEVQGYEVSQSTPDDQTVTVDDQGAVHLPSLAHYGDEGDRSYHWMIRDSQATAPITMDPDPVEDPAGRFELVDGTWRLRG